MLLKKKQSQADSFNDALQCNSLTSSHLAFPLKLLPPIICLHPSLSSASTSLRLTFYPLSLHPQICSTYRCPGCQLKTLNPSVPPLDESKPSQSCLSGFFSKICPIPLMFSLIQSILVLRTRSLAASQVSPLFSTLFLSFFYYTSFLTLASTCSNFQVHTLLNTCCC